MVKIIRNMIKCNDCGDIIESKSVHDYVTCSCGNCSVDGGHSYLRRGFNPGGKGYTDMSESVEVEDTDEQARKYRNKNN